MTLIVRGVIYPSVKAVAQAHNCTPRAVYKHLAKYGHLEWLGCKLPRARPDLRKAVRIGPHHFESMSAAALALGLSRKTIQNAMHKKASLQTVLRAVMAYHNTTGAA